MKNSTQTVKRYIWFTDDGNIEIIAHNHKEAMQVSSDLKRITPEQKKIVHTEPDMVLPTQCSDVQYTL